MKPAPFKPKSEINFFTAAEERERFIRYCQEYTNNILKIDLNEVSHCDSAGLALLIEIKQISKKYNKVCQIQNIPTIVQTIAEFCGIDSILKTSNLSGK